MITMEIDKRELIILCAKRAETLRNFLTTNSLRNLNHHDHRAIEKHLERLNHLVEKLIK